MFPFSRWLVVFHHPEFHTQVKKGKVKKTSSFFLQCLNTEQPLMILLEYSMDGVFLGAKCDAALPAMQKGRLVHFCDLDLDLMVKSDFSSCVRDRKDFQKNSQKMRYPTQVINLAHQGIELAQTLLTSRQFPFDGRFVPVLKPVLPLDFYVR
ncbi:MAG: hypothetical protein AB8B99_18310 [Phormidesmis sp.]